LFIAPSMAMPLAGGAAWPREGTVQRIKREAA
jgi:hypothetical protein